MVEEECTNKIIQKQVIKVIENVKFGKALDIVWITAGILKYKEAATYWMHII